MTLNRKLFNIYEAIDNNAKYPYNMHSTKPIRKEFRELSVSEIPLSIKQSLTRPVANPKVSNRLKRAVDAQTLDEEKIELRMTKVPDAYSMRAFKDYLYKEDIYHLTVLEDIPRLSQRPHSLEETEDITPEDRFLYVPPSSKAYSEIMST